MAIQVLTVNTGSSSVKMAVFALDSGEQRVLSAEAERVGLTDATFCVRPAPGSPATVEPLSPPTHDAAIDRLLSHLRSSGVRLDGVCHRVVFGGERHVEPQPITPSLVESLGAVAEMAPDHLPAATAAIQAVSSAYPTVPQFACFDTAFHARMPRVAQVYALPDQAWNQGVRRFGFHGLSCESVMRTLGEVDPAAANGRVIVAHLGGGSSMTAVREGVGIETTMGYSPAGGLVMGTRSGDLDPGVLLRALRRGLDAPALHTLVTRQSGMLGISGRSADMRELLTMERSDPRAALAVEVFCYSARKALGALLAVLGGVDTVVFTGGIGEHAAEVRTRIVTGLEDLGMVLDAGENQRNAPIISSTGSRTTLRVVAADEDRVLAQHAGRLLASAPPSPSSARL